LKRKSKTLRTIDIYRSIRKDPVPPTKIVPSKKKYDRKREKEEGMTWEEE
jgi:hypothetical protein